MRAAWRAAVAAFLAPEPTEPSLLDRVFPPELCTHDPDRWLSMKPHPNCVPDDEWGGQA